MNAGILSARLVAAWMTVALFLIFGAHWLADFRSTLWSSLLFLWPFGVILWCAFGVVREADHLAGLLGEPLGTLVLTLSIVIIEVVLIGAVALGGDSAPTLGRDTMFAVPMIVLNGAVGLCLLLGGLRHHEQAYNLQGAVAYLAVIKVDSRGLEFASVGDREFPVGSISRVGGGFCRQTDPCAVGAATRIAPACCADDHACRAKYCA
jgi:Ca2+:H+ antiporter